MITLNKEELFLFYLHSKHIGSFSKISQANRILCPGCFRYSLYMTEPLPKPVHHIFCYECEFQVSVFQGGFDLFHSGYIGPVKDKPYNIYFNKLENPDGEIKL